MFRFPRVLWAVTLLAILRVLPRCLRTFYADDLAMVLTIERVASAPVPGPFHLNCLLGCSAGGPVPGDAGTQRTCGGFAGIACPGFGRCVDGPSDGCDPKAGGADCGAVRLCTDTVACKRGTHFDANLDVCSCVADTSSP